MPFGSPSHLGRELKFTKYGPESNIFGINHLLFALRMKQHADSSLHLLSELLADFASTPEQGTDSIPPSKF